MYVYICIYIYIYIYTYIHILNIPACMHVPCCFLGEGDGLISSISSGEPDSFFYTRLKVPCSY